MDFESYASVKQSELTVKDIGDFTWSVIIALSGPAA